MHSLLAAHTILIKMYDDNIQQLKQMPAQQQLLERQLFMLLPLVGTHWLGSMPVVATSMQQDSYHKDANRFTERVAMNTVNGWALLSELPDLSSTSSNPHLAMFPSTDLIARMMPYVLDASAAVLGALRLQAQQAASANSPAAAAALDSSSGSSSSRTTGSSDSSRSSSAESTLKPASSQVGTDVHTHPSSCSTNPSLMGLHDALASQCFVLSGMLLHAVQVESAGTPEGESHSR
jgi:hypothetical protein